MVDGTSSVGAVLAGVGVNGSSWFTSTGHS